MRALRHINFDHCAKKELFLDDCHFVCELSFFWAMPKGVGKLRLSNSRSDNIPVRLLSITNASLVKMVTIKYENIA
jgi:hypothetical protein